MLVVKSSSMHTSENSTSQSRHSARAGSSDSSMDRLRLEPSWKSVLNPEFQKDYMIQLGQFLRTEKSKNKVIYPKATEFFAAFENTPVEKVKVVVLGQDPYHGPNQAHGLCFSVRPPTPPPPSLVNIFKELKADMNIPLPKHGSLVSWAQQGVLLLNATLSVEAERAGSHQNRGWETFTDCVVQYLNSNKSHLVFLLWGSYAQKKGAFIDRKKHLVLEAPHPSPLSAHRGFLGCKHFSKTNAYLQKNGIAPVEWSLSDV